MDVAALSVFLSLWALAYVVVPLVVGYWFGHRGLPLWAMISALVAWFGFTASMYLLWR